MFFHDVRQEYEHLHQVWNADRPAADKLLRTPIDIAAGLRLPVLGLIEREPKAWPDRYSPPLVTVQNPCSPASEAFRALRMQVQAAMTQRPLQSLLVISPEHAASQTTVAANLAVVMAMAGQTVILLDANVQAPQVRRLFTQHVGAGLLPVLQGPESSWIMALAMTGVKNLITVAAEAPEDTQAQGARPDAALLGSPQMQAFMRHVQAMSDLVLIDAPALPAAGAMLLARQIGGAILVIEQGKTHLRAAQQAMRQLQQAGTRVLGAVLTEVPQRRLTGY
jgi:capsular exopolysaccharide synthesis family protein